jgi:hypothetical protein
MPDAIDRIRKESSDSLRKQRLEQAKRRKLYAECFGTKAGQEVLKDMMVRSYWFSTTSSRTNAETNMNEGARMWVVEINRIIPGIFGYVQNAYNQEIEAMIQKELLSMEGDL